MLSPCLNDVSTMPKRCLNDAAYIWRLQRFRAIALSQSICKELVQELASIANWQWCKFIHTVEYTVCLNGI